MKILQIVGYSSSGKTYLAANIIEELKNRGFSVASAKSIGCGKACKDFDKCKLKEGGDYNFSIDSKDTDTSIHTQAGASPVVAWSKRQASFINNREFELWELISEIRTDYLIIEGGKRFDLPRIVTARTIEDVSPLVNEFTFAISGPIADKFDQIHGYKTYRSLKDIDKLVDLIEERTPEALAYQDIRGCRICGTSCKDLLKDIMNAKESSYSCKKMYPEIKADLTKEEKEKLSNIFLKLDKFPKNIEVKLS